MSVETSSTIATQVLRAVQEGRELDAEAVRSLASASDILALGALADDVRRRHRGTAVTFVRVHVLDLAGIASWTAPPPAAQEVRLVGELPHLDALVEAIRAAKALSGGRALRGCALAELWNTGRGRALQAVAEAGLDEVAWVEAGADAEVAVTAARAAGLGARVVGLAVPPSDRAAWLVTVRTLQHTVGGLDVVAPLPRVSDPTAPTTGFDDVRAIALARLALDGRVSIQVDWRKDGPKLAQVALTVGADDLDLVSPDDDLSRGPRRAPLEDVRRNIAAAGLTAVERDARHHRLAE